MSTPRVVIQCYRTLSHRKSSLDKENTSFNKENQSKPTNRSQRKTKHKPLLAQKPLKKLSPVGARTPNCTGGKHRRRLCTYLPNNESDDKVVVQTCASSSHSKRQNPSKFFELSQNEQLVRSHGSAPRSESISGKLGRTTTQTRKSRTSKAKASSRTITSSTRAPRSNSRKKNVSKAFTKRRQKKTTTRKASKGRRTPPAKKSYKSQKSRRGAHTTKPKAKRSHKNAQPKEGTRSTKSQNLKSIKQQAAPSDAVGSTSRCEESLQFVPNPMSGSCRFHTFEPSGFCYCFPFNRQSHISVHGSAQHSHPCPLTYTMNSSSLQTGHALNTRRHNILNSDAL